MVFIYSLRPVYTFLYTIKNANVIASFVQKTKSFEILWSKKIFLTYVLNPEPSPPPPLYAIVRNNFSRILFWWNINNLADTRFKTNFIKIHHSTVQIFWQIYELNSCQVKVPFLCPLNMLKTSGFRVSEGIKFEVIHLVHTQNFLKN